MRATYDRLRQVGKPAKLALTAVMRNLLLLANALLKANRTWSPKNLDQYGYYERPIEAALQYSAILSSPPHSPTASPTTATHRRSHKTVWRVRHLSFIASEAVSTSGEKTYSRMRRLPVAISTVTAMPGLSGVRLPSIVM
jgi:hypothetical protein